MDLTISLDGSRRRDIKLWAGDEVTLNVIVRTLDTDALPVVVDTPRLITREDDVAFPVGTQFTVSEDYPGRRWYWIKGEIAGVTTTLAYGVLEICGGDSYPSGTDYGWGWRWNYPT